MKIITHSVNVLGYGSDGFFEEHLPVLDWQVKYLEKLGVKCTPIKFADYEVIKVQKKKVNNTANREAISYMEQYKG